MATATRGAIGIAPQFQKGTVGSLANTKWFKGHTVSIALTELSQLFDLEIGDSLLPSGGFKAGRWVVGQLELTPRVDGDLGWLLWGFAGTMKSTDSPTTGNVHVFPATGTAGAPGPDNLISDKWFTIRRVLPGDVESDDFGEVFTNCQVISLNISAAAANPLRMVVGFLGLDIGTPVEDPYNDAAAWTTAYEGFTGVPMSMEATLTDPDNQPIATAQAMQISLGKNVLPPQREMVLGSYAPRAITDNGHIVQAACTYFWGDADNYRKVVYGSASGTAWQKGVYTGGTNFSLTFKTASGICGTGGAVPGELGFRFKKAIWNQVPVVLVPGEPPMMQQTATVISVGDGTSEDWAVWLKNNSAGATEYVWPVA